MSTVFITLKKLWPATIRGQLILGITLVHLLLMTIFVFDLVGRQRDFLKNQNHEQAFSFANDYAVNSTPYIIANDFDELEGLTKSHINFPNLKYAMILSPEGVVLAHTNTNFIGKKPTDETSLKLKEATGSKTLIENDHVLDIAVPILVDKKMVGWARLGVGQDYIQSNLAAIVREGILYIIIALIVGVFFALLIANTLTVGLHKLISTANKIKGGDRTVRAVPFKSFELSQLGTAFNQTLDEISANEKLLSMVIENMPVGVWILDEKGKIISTNSAGKRIWNGTRYVGIDEFGAYKAWTADTKELIPPELRPAALAIRKGQTTINKEIEIETFNGNRKSILNSAIPLKGKEGEIVGAISINVDITERKNINEQLTLSESTLRSAFEYSAIGMSLVSADGKFLRVNKELCKMLGYSEQELLLLTFQDITYPEDLERDLSLVKQTLEGKIDTYRMEKRYFGKHRNLIWIHLSVSLVRDSENKPLFFVSQIEDISERKKSEILIKESEEKFRKLVEESQAGVFILQRGKFVYINPQFERITGYSEEVLLTEMSFEQLIHTDGQEKTWKNYLSGINQEKPSSHYLLKATRKDGATLQLETILSSITYEEKPAVIGTIIDITEHVEEEKRISKAVTDAQENERQQISMELHDNVKQMMAACLLNVDFIKMIVKDEKTSPIINNIKNYIRDAIEELRRISHQLAPSMDASIPFEEKIKTIVSTMNVSERIEINYHFDEFEETIKADVQLAMYRIVQEQVANILKHAKASLVDITVQKRNGDICMSIEDNGVGFESHLQKNGIGLENMKRRVQAFNGNFNIQTVPGKGCKLYVELPVS